MKFKIFSRGKFAEIDFAPLCDADKSERYNTIFKIATEDAKPFTYFVKSVATEINRTDGSTVMIVAYIDQVFTGFQKLKTEKQFDVFNLVAELKLRYASDTATVDNPPVSKPLDFDMGLINRICKQLNRK